MIYAFNFTCSRDKDLADLMQHTLLKHCKDIQIVISVNTDTNEEYKGYGCGAGWPAGLLKVKYLGTLFERYEIQDSDFVLSIDSDVVFTSPEVFKYVDTAYGIIGTQHQQPYKSEFGLFGHMSGAMIFLRGDIARKIAAMSDQELDRLRFDHFKKHNITENEDVMLSYFAKYVGGEAFDIGCVPGLTSGDFEQDLWRDLRNAMVGCIHPELNRRNLKSFYHLNYSPESFLGEQMNGAKWDIPKVLKQKGIEL